MKMDKHAHPHFVDRYPWLGMDVRAVKQDLARHYHLTLGRDHGDCGERFLYEAAALAVRDRIVERWRQTRERNHQQDPRRVSYLSLEFLMGRAFSNAVLNLDMAESMRQALKDFGCAFEMVVDQEQDAGLGNGGLGRLAACFLDSCATLHYPVTGYGIRYDYGIFEQKIKDGYQLEVPDHWLEGGSPWEFVALDNTRQIKFGGHTETYVDAEGRQHSRWLGTADVLAVPHDIPVPGYHNDNVITLRLWKAESADKFDLNEFNSGDFNEAVASQNAASRISMVLYPNDASVNGRILRLRQQYFLSSASLQDVISRWLEQHSNSFDGFADKNCFQLNDTHPAVAVPELMRLLMDEYLMDWEAAWALTRRTMAYTNHTLLPEALERWSVPMFAEVLPRLLEIIYEINRRFLLEVAEKWPGDTNKAQAMSIIEEGGEHHIRMAFLAIVGSFSVNGVAALHTTLLKEGLFHDFYQLWPERFNNKTNGVTPRRWLLFCNPGLADLVSRTIGRGWISNLDELEKLRDFADEAKFQKKWQAVKTANKVALADFVKSCCDVDFDPGMLFDVQVKRIHEYKRQLLNVLHIIHLYDRIVRGDTATLAPRCVLIGGKAAPGYFIAKLIIKLINNVAAVINADQRAQPYLRVAFLPNYRVTAMEKICPGTDLSEQISTAGKEASGTGNMKLMMNGAVTIGTMDGANIEIRGAVGAENFFLFGLNALEVESRRRDYQPNLIIANDPDLLRVMAMLDSGFFSKDENGLFEPLCESIRNPHDPWLTAADFRSYVDAQQEAGEAFMDKGRWTRMSILNTAASGHFSSDRTIREYAREIWKL
ncbi:MAG: glycogen/starch/alpha-glucan phosphorylase [Pseudomonadales bacterium]|nr:glycogen/starch/alpha-glucan phosphorylase [Pseudomonadales bacterium]